MLELKKINVIFNKSTPLENQVLKNINLTINRGDFITIIGGNGAGKSTLLNTIAGNTLQNSGQIILDGLDISNLPTNQRAKYIATVFQDPMIGTCAGLTIEENLCLAAARGKKRGISLSTNSELKNIFKERLAEVNIGLENRLADKVMLLSGGQRQILSLIMATLAPSKILLLDEHTAALDPKMAKIVLNLTKFIVDKHHLPTLMITHSMNQALELGNRTIMMYHGKIYRDLSTETRKSLTPAELLSFFDLAS